MGQRKPGVHVLGEDARGKQLPIVIRCPGRDPPTVEPSATWKKTMAKPGGAGAPFPEGCPGNPNTVFETGFQPLRDAVDPPPYIDPQNDWDSEWATASIGTSGGAAPAKKKGLCACFG